MLFDVMFLNRYGGHGTIADTRMDQHTLQLVCNVDTCRNVYKLNNVSSSDVIVTPPSQTQPGLLATAVPHSIPVKPRKVCTSFSHDCECGSVCILHLHFCDVMMSLQVM